MKKSFPYISVLVAIALFSGCGGSSDTTVEEEVIIVDTTAPSVTSDRYVYENILEQTDVSVTLISDDLEADFFETSSSAAIQGSILTFTAPAFIEGDANSYIVPVTAKDEAGNESNATEFTFTVVEDNSGTYEANISVVALVGDKTFTADGSYLVGPTGLLWVDEVSPLMAYDDAVTHCTSKGEGFRVALRTELLNTINYELDDVSINVSLLDEDFSISRAGTGDDEVATSWAALENGYYYVINNFSGADVKVNATDEHRVRCVKGDSASTHTFSANGDNFIDNDTELEWTVIDTGAMTRTYGRYDDGDDADMIGDALGFCPVGFTIPTINQLRSIYDTSTNTLSSEIAPTGIDSETYWVWSSTQYTNGSGTAYFTLLNEQNTSIRSDEQNQTHYVTCVK